MRLALGTAAFGDADRGSWNVGRDRAIALVTHAVERGVIRFDTGTSYGGGLAEDRLGEALANCGARNRVHITTKVYFPSSPGAGDGGLSRAAITAAVDRSLARLRTDRIDMLMIHRWDATVPIMETLTTLDELVRSGRVLSVGASSMSAWRLMKALAVQRTAGFAPFSAMQGLHNLLYREEEREMIPLCAEEGVSYQAWSPLARGRLAGAAADRRRLRDDPLAVARYEPALDEPVLAALDRAAAATGMPHVALALGWLARRGIMPVIGASTIAELNTAITAVEMPCGTDLTAVEAAYRPHPVIGFDPTDEAGHG